MYLRIAASVVFLGIAIGAFGAHMLEDILTEHDQIDNWETGCLYHLIHGLALMLCATVLPSRKLSFWAFLRCRSRYDIPCIYRRGFKRVRRRGLSGVF